MEMMLKAGYEVSSASNGVQALEACYREHFDLAVVDMVMPIQDGFVTVAKLALNHGYLKIIAISGGDRSFEGASYLDLVENKGAHRTFVKPFDRREFMQAVKDLLGPESK